MQCDLLRLSFKDSKLANSEHLSSMACRPTTDGLGRIMSSAYIMHPKNTFDIDTQYSEALAE